ncbi:17239_t:CDS:2, partial [Cetraspora pellucida]
ISYDDKTDLDDDMTKFLPNNDPEQSPDHNVCLVPSPDNYVGYLELLSKSPVPSHNDGNYIVILTNNDTEVFCLIIMLLSSVFSQ